MRLREIIPEGLKDYLRLVAAKLRHRESYIGSSHIAGAAKLGRNCSIGRGVEIGADVRIGDCTYINFGAIVGCGEIGRYCSIGPYAIIGMPEHPTSFLSTSPRLYGCANLLGYPADWDEHPAPPVIGSDVWIGAHALVRQGVRIGAGAIVGANSVVTRDVAPYEIVGGVPARIIRSRFSPEVVRALLDNRWWDRPLEELKNRADCFQAPPEAWLSFAPAVWESFR